MEEGEVKENTDDVSVPVIVINVVAKDHDKKKWQALIKGSDGDSIPAGSLGRFDFLDELIDDIIRILPMKWPDVIFKLNKTHIENEQDLWGAYFRKNLKSKVANLNEKLIKEYS